MRDLGMSFMHHLYQQFSQAAVYLNCIAQSVILTLKWNDGLRLESVSAARWVELHVQVNWASSLHLNWPKLRCCIHNSHQNTGFHTGKILRLLSSLPGWLLSKSDTKDICSGERSSTKSKSAEWCSIWNWRSKLSRPSSSPSSMLELHASSLCKSSKNVTDLWDLGRLCLNISLPASSNDIINPDCRAKVFFWACKKGVVHVIDSESI